VIYTSGDRALNIGITVKKLRNGTAIVTGVAPDGFAALADFRVGDEIMKIGRRRIEDVYFDEENPLDWRLDRR
jgi:C-terminal processing protease CtpA/Prc